MATYITRPQTVQAVQFTREMAEGSQPLPRCVVWVCTDYNFSPTNTYASLASGGSYSYETFRNIRFINEGIYPFRISVGDWIVEQDGSYTIMDNETFNMTYCARSCGNW